MKSSTKNLQELYRYGIIGLLSAISNFGISNLLHIIGFPSWLSAGGAWIIALAVSYIGHIHFTYKVTPQHARMSTRFMVLTALNFCVTQGLTYGIHDFGGAPYYVAALAVVVTIPLISWPMGKFWVFKPSV